MRVREEVQYHQPFLAADLDRRAQFAEHTMKEGDN
jgi:hypothetical protein